MAMIGRYPAYKFLFALVDAATIVGSLLLAGLASAALAGGPAPEVRSATLLLYAGYAVLGFFVYQAHDLYRISVFMSVVDQGVRLVRAVLVLVLVIALVTFFLKVPGAIESRLLLACFAVLCVAIGFAVRVLAGREIYGYLSREGVLERTLLVVGAEKTGLSLAVNVFLHPHLGVRVAGFLDDTLAPGTPVFQGTKVLGRVDDLAEAVRGGKIDEVAVCLESADHARLMQVVESAVHTRARVKVASELYEVVPSRLMIERYGDIPVIDVTRNEPGRITGVTKRVFDLTAASVAVVALAPLFVLIALAIVLDTPGPVIFSQTRIGRRGKPFTFYKFRSMEQGSERDAERERAAASFVRLRKRELPAGHPRKIVNDRRVTRVGRLLRRTSLDELPQLFNVLKGEMSLVGPRPSLPYEWEAYEEWHKRRLAVLPGCTGLWQVHARSQVGFEDMVMLDLYYIQNATPWMDLKLILKTIPVMLFGTGAR